MLVVVVSGKQHHGAIWCGVGRGWAGHLAVGTGQHGNARVHWDLSAAAWSFAPQGEETVTAMKQQQQEQAMRDLWFYHYI